MCTEDYEKTGKWHCLVFLKDLEFFLFGGPEAEELDALEESGEVNSMEDLLRALEGDAGEE